MILLATFGSGGDLEPFILMASGLQSRGHRVCILASIDHLERLHASGLPHRVYATPAIIDAMLQDPGLWHERRGLGVIARGLSAILDEIIELICELAGPAPCVALCHPFMLPAAAIARARHPRLRVVGAWLAPSNLRSIHDPLMIGRRRIAPWVPLGWRRALWRFVDRTWIDNHMLPGLNAVRTRRGLAVVDRYFAHLPECADAALGLFPAWFAKPAPDWPRPFMQGAFPLSPGTPATLDDEIEAFLAAGAPPIVFTFGTAMRHAAPLFEAGRDALRAVGRRGMFITRHAAQVPRDLPGDVLWVPCASFASLLPRVAGIVHHGGIGTAAEALRAGIPQLALAFGFDQFDNGLRLRELGVGDMLPADRVDARSLQARLERLLASPVTASACKVAATRLAGSRDGDMFMAAVAAAVDGQAPAGGGPAPLAGQRLPSRADRFDAAPHAQPPCGLQARSRHRPPTS